MSANNDFVPRKATETKIASAKTAPRSIRKAGLIPLLILVSRIRRRVALLQISTRPKRVVLKEHRSFILWFLRR